MATEFEAPLQDDPNNCSLYECDGPAHGPCTLGRITTATYDPRGQQTQRHDPYNYVTTYSFDPAGRPTGRLYPDGSRATFAFDEVGNRTQMRDSTGVYTYTYDAANRQASIANEANAATFTYDTMGNRTVKSASPGGVTTYAFDSLDRQESEVNPLGDRFTFVYDTVDRRTLVRKPDGSRTSLVFNAANQLTSQYNLKSDNSVISGFDYREDRTGNRLGVTEATGQKATWTYDDTYQLVNEHRSGTGGFNLTYLYDSVGNRLVKNSAGALTTSTYDAANQLQTAVDTTGTTTFVFDATGNQQVDQAPSGATTYAWNYENQMTGVVKPDGSRVTMMYNANFRRTDNWS